MSVAKLFRRMRTSAIAVLVLALAACEPAQEQSQAPAEQPPPPVDVANPIVKTIVDWDEFTGRFEAVDRVELRARVSGYLDAVHFNDGQLVNKGDLLFTIDQRPFAAEIERVKAEIEQARAKLLGFLEKTCGAPRSVMDRARTDVRISATRRADVGELKGHLDYYYHLAGHPKQLRSRRAVASALGLSGDW